MKKEKRKKTFFAFLDPNEPPIEYSIHKNLFVSLKIVSSVDRRLNCRENSTWIFTTRGLAGVSQDELIYLFADEQIDDEQTFISDLLIHIHQIYLDATKGSFVRHLCLSFASVNSSKFLSNENAAGFLYVSDSNVTNEFFPEAPFLFGLVVQRDELPTAQCFPIRLLLRLGFEYQSKTTQMKKSKTNFHLVYPWPLFSVFRRPTMFNDTQQTIMSLLCVRNSKRNEQNRFERFTKSFCSKFDRLTNEKLKFISIYFSSVDLNDSRKENALFFLGLSIV